MKHNISKTFGVYVIKNLSNGKIYIGSTTRSFSNRWGQWRSDLKHGRTSNRHLNRAWAKYGPESFLFEVLEVVEEKNDVLAREQYYIDTLKPEYNICKIAGCPAVDAEPWNKGNGSYMEGEKNHFFGKKHSEEAIARMSEAAFKRTNIPWNTGKREGTSNTSLWRYRKEDGLVVSKPKGFRQERLCKCGERVRECYKKDGTFNCYYKTCGRAECRSHPQTQEARQKISESKRKAREAKQGATESRDQNQ